jgi:uncharacterized protein YegP (UPF0339 family)
MRVPRQANTTYHVRISFTLLDKYRCTLYDNLSNAKGAFMAAKFEMYTDRAKKYRFRLKATNGEIIASGEAYDTRAACLKGIKSVQKNAPTAAIIDPDAAGKKAAAPKTPIGKKAPAAAKNTPKKPRSRTPKAAPQA